MPAPRKPSFAQRAKKLDTFIKNGRHGDAAAALTEMLARRPPREELAPWAALAMRAGVPALGVRLLNPIVRAEDGATSDATDEERAEYAACLIKLGALDEGRAILESGDVMKTARAPLYASFAHVARWEYAEAIPLLRRYVESKAISPYERLVGKANLAGALVYERKGVPAEALLRQLLFTGSLRRYALVLGVVLDYSAANFILRGKYDLAERLLDRSRKMLGASGGLDSFFNRKWRAILSLARAPRDAAARDEVRAICDEARGRQHWETVRDCDRYLALLSKDRDLALHLYFGSPSQAFRERLEKDWHGGALAPPAQMAWRLGGSAPVAPVIDPIRNGPPALLHRLLSALLSDFYRPFRVTALYRQLYPNEYYNPLSSPHRVHEAVNRLRKWFSSERIPLKIIESDGSYAIGADAPCAVMVRLDGSRRSDSERHLDRLRENMPEGRFSVNDAARALDLSVRSASRVLGEGVTSGRLVRIGEGRSTRYSFGTEKRYLAGGSP